MGNSQHNWDKIQPLRRKPSSQKLYLIHLGQIKLTMSSAALLSFSFGLFNPPLGNKHVCMYVCDLVILPHLPTYTPPYIRLCKKKYESWGGGFPSFLKYIVHPPLCTAPCGSITPLNTLSYIAWRATPPHRIVEHPTSTSPPSLSLCLFSFLL
jgi:hypothetical protein